MVLGYFHAFYKEIPVQCEHLKREALQAVGFVTPQKNSLEMIIR